MNYQTPELRRALTADYAIGLMPPTARRRFEHLLQGDAPCAPNWPAGWNTSTC